jgi:hypothetical protein
MEIFNELQHRDIGDLYVTTFRGVIALGKRMTTRLDVPLVYNSVKVQEQDQFGIGDISVRLLGYKFLESKRAALLASVEFSFNTAQSSLLGTGKNLISPVLTYSWRIPRRRSVVAVSVQQFYSLWGDESRKDIRWTKLQAFFLHAWTQRIWTLLRPETYLDHYSGELSMNLEGSVYYRVSHRFAFWAKGGAGLFGDHPGRYLWTMETGIRYLMMRKESLPFFK